jgi:hypothetical protein
MFMLIVMVVILFKLLGLAVVWVGMLEVFELGYVFCWYIVFGLVFW